MIRSVCFAVAFLFAAECSAAPLFRDFMGINGHTVQFKPDLYAPIANLVRDYHPVEWDLGKDSDFATQFPAARNGVNWQTVYGSWRKAGWTVDVCLMFETLPRKEWKDLAADSRAYGERFARAFGPSSSNPLVESVEIGNEPGKFNDADYRIIFENLARGVKAGDPNGCNRNWWSVALGLPVRFPKAGGAVGSESEHRLGVGFLPPRPGQLQSFLNDVAVPAFHFT